MIFGKHTKYVVGYRVFSSFFQNNSHVYIPVGRCAQNWRIESKSVFKILLMHIRSSSRKHSNTVYGISKKKKKEKTNKKKNKRRKKNEKQKATKKAPTTGRTNHASEFLWFPSIDRQSCISVENAEKKKI